MIEIESRLHCIDIIAYYCRFLQRPRRPSSLISKTSDEIKIDTNLFLIRFLFNLFFLLSFFINNLYNKNTIFHKNLFLWKKLGLSYCLKINVF